MRRTKDANILLYQVLFKSKPCCCDYKFVYINLHLYVLVFVKVNILVHFEGRMTLNRLIIGELSRGTCFVTDMMYKFT